MNAQLRSNLIDLIEQAINNANTEKKMNHILSWLYYGVGLVDGSYFSEIITKADYVYYTGKFEDMKKRLGV
jgi:hypothetical protein